MHRKMLAMVLAAVCLLLGAPAAAQQMESRIIGTVTDQNGGVLPGVTVVITATATGRVRTAVSDGQGRFTVTNLDPGSYQVAYELSGFAPRRQDVVLGVGETRPADVALPVADIRRCHPSSRLSRASSSSRSSAVDGELFDLRRGHVHADPG